MFLLFRSFLRVHRNRRCIYMFVVWQTKSSKLFCWNMKPYGKIFLSEHVNDTIRVWFETIINRYPHTFQWRQNSTCFRISSLECGVFHSPVFFESMMLRRYQWLYQRQVVRRVHLWGCGQTHEGCPPHTPTAADKIQFVIFVRSTKEFEKWFEFEVRLLNFRIYFFYNYMSQSHLSIYILLCSHIYKYRNMQVLFLMVKLPVNCSQLSNEKTLVVWGI